MLGDIKNFVLPHILYEKIVCQQTDIQTIFLFLENLWLEFQMFSGLFFSFGKWFKRNHDFPYQDQAMARSREEEGQIWY